MKKLIVLCALIFAASSSQAGAKKAVAAKAVDPVEAFEAIIKEASSPREWSGARFNTRTQKWVVRYFNVGEVTYDVRKTESLVTPVLGVVNFPLAVSQSATAETQEMAESAPDPVPGKYDPRYSLEGTYVFKGGSWHLREFKYKDVNPSSGLFNSVFEFTEEKIKKEPNAFMSEVVQKWVR